MQEPVPTLNTTQSQTIPFTVGVVEVDSSAAPVTFGLLNGDLASKDQLLIRKLSSDNNPVCLYSSSSQIDGNDIVVFGRRNGDDGEGREIVMHWNGTQWIIDAEN